MEATTQTDSRISVLYAVEVTLNSNGDQATHVYMITEVYTPCLSWAAIFLLAEKQAWEGPANIAQVELNLRRRRFTCLGFEQSTGDK